MRVLLIKNDRIHDIKLPDKADGSYWISDNDSNGIKRNLISIEPENGRWKVISNKEVYFVANNKVIPFVYLQEGSFYTLRNEVEKTNLLIYCAPFYTNFTYYDIESNIDNGIYIGSGENCLINYKFIESNSIFIKKIDGELYIFDNKSKYGVYVNNIRVKDKQVLNIGDVVFILGLKLVFISCVNNNKVYYYLGVNLNNNVAVRLLPSKLPDTIDSSFKEDELDIESPLYDESEYFHKNPRFVYSIKPLDLVIDAPPARVEKNDNPVLLTIGPMITMSMTSMVSGYSAVSGVLSGNSTWKNAIPSLIICGAMLASMFIWPLFTKWYEGKTRRRNEKMRQRKYGAYIEKKRNQIVEAKREQEDILRTNCPDSMSAENVIKNKFVSLWQRRIEDNDFLSVNLGYGNYPMKINIKYPEDHFSMTEDNLKDMMSKLGNEPKVLTNVPVVYSFIEDYISGIIGENDLTAEYFRRILIQLLAFHSYDDLKIIVLTDEENEYKWEFLKSVPHCFTDDRSLRFFATTNDEYKEVCYYLDQVFNSRSSDNKKSDIKHYDKLYLIFTDCFKRVRNFDVISNILDNDLNYGMNIVVLDKNVNNLPDKCKSFVQLNNSQGELHTILTVEEPVKFNVDLSKPIDYEKCSKILANIPIEITSNEEGHLPDKLGFLEMFDVGKIEQLNSQARWKESNPMLNLQVPVGVGKNGEKISMDLHEKYHGPHGLIAGMTGSGKSEFIITYILSLAVNYHPYEVQFILIDYKGGGLAGAFENKNTGLKLPHLVGTITNLDANEIKRSLASIDSELKRRQSLFNKARTISGESTIDIYKYQRMFREGQVAEPISHLFIICDEFAELKNQQPEFMEQLISTARIGRSLGVHLILATQKPSGVVDPQIWSNTRFRVCLRVQDKSDSNEVIKCPDAAFLKRTGRFYFQVGYNEVFVLGQAAWAGGKYVPAERVNKNIDTSINFINNIGYITKTIETREKKSVETSSNGEELLNIVKYLSNIAIQNNIVTRPLWLEKIPGDIRIDSLAQKYNYKNENFVINPIIGEYDMPSMQKQELLTLPLSQEGNTLIYGASGSGKENFITTMIYSSMLYYSPSEVNYYIIDFGSEALKMFKKSPIVGNILNSNDEEEIMNLFKMIESTIEERKNLFAEYNGDYYTYCKNSGKTVPNMVIIINNYEAYQETYSQFDDTLIMLSRDCSKYGVFFVLTVNTPSGLRFKLRQNFALTYVLQQNMEDDYSSILGNIHKNYPAKIFGRGIIKKDSIYEFQTAFVCEKENIPKFIREKCEQCSISTSQRAKAIPILPKTVDFNSVKDMITNNDDLIIGLNKDTLNASIFNFRKNYISMVTSLDINMSSFLINPLIDQMLYKDTTNLIIINAEDYYINDEKVDKFEYVDYQFNEIFEKLNDYVTTQKKNYESNNFDNRIFKDKKPITVIIVGLDSLINKLNPENKNKLPDLFINGKDLGIINYIIVDSIDNIKKHEYDNWYKNCVNNSCGIWIGNGIDDQFTLKISQKIPEMRDSDIPDNFCFVINRGKIEYVKFIESFKSE